MRRAHAASLSDSDLRQLCCLMVGLHPQAYRIQTALTLSDGRNAPTATLTITYHCFTCHGMLASSAKYTVFSTAKCPVHSMINLAINLATNLRRSRSQPRRRSDCSSSFRRCCAGPRSAAEAAAAASNLRRGSHRCRRATQQTSLRATDSWIADVGPLRLAVYGRCLGRGGGARATHQVSHPRRQTSSNRV